MADLGISVDALKVLMINRLSCWPRRTCAPSSRIFARVDSNAFVPSCFCSNAYAPGFEPTQLENCDPVMLPKIVWSADIVSVHQDIPLGELMKVFEKAGHSRLVVYDDTLDDPVGLVHIRDLIGYMTAQAAVSAQSKIKRKKPLPADLDLGAIDLATPLSQSKIVRTILFVPPSMPTLDLLAKMQATRIHLALVIDEYGGTDGLVSIEDIVEQVVGEIDDEHDSDEPPAIVRQADNSFIADARASLDDARKVIGEEFVTGEAGEEVETLGGYLVSQVGRLPVRGELIAGPGNFEVEVLDADPRRVKRLRIAIRKERPAPRNSPPWVQPRLRPSPRPRPMPSPPTTWHR